MVGFSAARAPTGGSRRMVRAGPRRRGDPLRRQPRRAARPGAALIAAPSGDPRPAGLRDPLLVMVDQEGGLVKRLGGAPSASAAQMGGRGAAFSRRQGSPPAANLRDVGVNVDLAPVLDVARPGGDIAETERGFGSSAGAVARPRFRLRRRCRAAAWPRPPSTSPASARAPEHRFRGAAGRPLEGDAAAGRRGALPGLRRRRRRDGDAQHRDLPGLLAEPAAFAAPDRHRRAALPPRLRGGLDHRRAGHRRRAPTSAGRRRPGIAAVRAGTDLLLFTDYRAPRPAPAGAAAPAAHRRPAPRRLRSVGGRVLRLRHCFAGG